MVLHSSQMNLLFCFSIVLGGLSSWRCDNGMLLEVSLAFAPFSIQCWIQAWIVWHSKLYYRRSQKICGFWCPKYKWPRVQPPPQKKKKKKKKKRPKVSMRLNKIYILSCFLFVKPYRNKDFLPLFCLELNLTCMIFFNLAPPKNNTSFFKTAGSTWTNFGFRWPLTAHLTAIFKITSIA